jgi:3'5'-cyclic nucleotide phosphodiesterase
VATHRSSSDGVPNAKDGRIVHHTTSRINCLNEVQQVIKMKDDISSLLINPMQNDTIELDPKIEKDLHTFVMIISKMYHDSNPFHNFEHACHVTMSVSKLQRILTPDISDDQMSPSKESLHGHLKQSTYGIYTDPIAQFAIVFSALVHDIDHRGCSNSQLAIEEPMMATQYRNQSIAEQNSFDLAWGLFMTNQWEELRYEVFRTSSNILHFRQVVMNSVLATDIFHQEMNDLRQKRWHDAFSLVWDHNTNEKDTMDRKATIVIELILQASDVAHTMQHWQIYRKWNTNLFREMYIAYQNGRMIVDPITSWYQNELNLFDNYIIPLAKKLKDCALFGISSDEYLNYALDNRKQWEQQAKSVMEELIQSVQDLS